MPPSNNIAAPIGNKQGGGPPALIALLGAGQARRFGADKLSQPCAGKPLGRWALDSAMACGLPVVWIAGEQAPPFVDGVCPIVHNPQASAGIGTSVALAATLAAAEQADTLLILLADMPLVTPVMLARLIAAGAPAACAQADGRPGVPALIPAAAFSALQALTGDRGAGPVLAALPDLSLIPCQPHELLDVDQPEALAKAAIWLEQGPNSPLAFAAPL